MPKSKGPKVEFVAALLLVVLFSVLAFPGASAVKKSVPAKADSMQIVK